MFSQCPSMSVSDKQLHGIVLKNVVINLLHASVFPSILTVLYVNDVILLGTLKVTLILFFLIFVVFPLAFKFSYTLQRSVIFLNFVNIPKNCDYSKPEKLGLHGSRNVYVRTDEDVTLGVWEILPEEFANASEPTEEHFNTVLANCGQVLLYNHGNAGNRAGSHRVDLYKILRKDFFVVAFDYRSYGDSTDIEPSELGLVSDSRFMFEWLRNRTTGNIFVWGHSLGTAISTRALSILASKNVEAAGLILESPFNNMREEISEHNLASLFRYLPWFSYTVLEPMMENGLNFETDRHILKINYPILILHAKDDIVVPYKLGHKLFETASKNSMDLQGPVKFIGFEGKFGYGHKFICHAPELRSIITDFVDECKMRLKNMNAS